MTRLSQHLISVGIYNISMLKWCVQFNYTAAAAARDVCIYDTGVTEATAILTTWTELIATTLPGVDRVQFYGAPPKDLLIMFSIWPADSLVLLMGGEAYAQDWVLDPIHLWARMEEGNMALLQLPRYDAVYPRIDAFASNDDVIFAPPPSPSDYTMMTPPPSYAEATSSLIKSHLLRITTETLRERTYENEKKKKRKEKLGQLDLVYLEMLIQLCCLCIHRTFGAR